MASNKIFIPHQTKVDTRVLTNGPGPQTHDGNLYIEYGGDLVGNRRLIDNNYRHTNFCGLCDFRGATVLINVFSMVWTLFVVIIIEFSADIDTIWQFELGMVGTIFIILHACGIYGALYYKRWGVIVGGTAYALAFLRSLIAQDIAGVLSAALFLYPHYFLHKLMKDGIMTEDNYHKIANCC